MWVSFLFCHCGRAKSNFSRVYGGLSALCFHSTVLDAQSGQEEEAGECEVPRYIFHGICGTLVKTWVFKKNFFKSSFFLSWNLWSSFPDHINWFKIMQENACAIVFSRCLCIYTVAPCPVVLRLTSPSVGLYRHSFFGLVLKMTPVLNVPPHMHRSPQEN